MTRTLGGTRHKYYNKQFNNFWSPLAGSGITAYANRDPENEIKRLQLQIGSKLFPEYSTKSHAEAFYSLRKALGVQSSALHSIDIDGNSYRNNKLIVGFETEKLLGLSFTGMNTRNNLMTVHLKTSVGDHQSSRMRICSLTEQILEIGDVGRMVYN